MYKLHLILKYLRKRRIAWVSLIAVMLCTAMVIVVISVMGGWLRMFKESFHDITGDIVISRRSLTGFPYYQEMLDQIQKLPDVAAAAPTLRTYGLINVLVGRESRFRDMVQVVGLPLEKMEGVTGFRQSLYRQDERFREAQEDPKSSAAEREEAKARLAAPATFEKPLPPEVYKDILPNSKVDVTKWPGIIVGAGVVGITKDEKGQVYRPPNLYEARVQLTVVAVTEETIPIDVAERQQTENFWIVDDSRTKVWQYDSSTVYVPFDLLQRDLQMNGGTQTDQKTGETIVQPPRTNDIHISVKSSADLLATRAKIQKIVNDVLSAHQYRQQDMDPVKAQTWQEFNAKFIAAVEKEKVLVTFLFGIISIVAIFLIFCIFYMIVVEKTKDIGIVKSVGATSGGVAGIFLGYGLAIGIVGSLLGLLFGYGIVHNINFLHTKMGELMGVQIWNPETYAFDIIPNQMNPPEVAVIMAIAIVASVLGALVPAMRAANLHPVEALRWE